MRTLTEIRADIRALEREAEGLLDDLLVQEPRAVGGSPEELEMRNEKREKSFDCVAFMREARDRISDKMATMSREEFRHWLRSYRYSDPVLQPLADEAWSGKRKDSEAPASVER